MGCSRYIVSGKVQGVGFRAYVRRQARALGVSGWVRNRSDGSVEVSACGTERQLQDLTSVLRRGPPGSQVVGVETFVSEDPGGPLLFTVRHDGP